MREAAAPARHAPTAALQFIRPWPGALEDCCCVTTWFSWEVSRSGLPASPGIDMPPRIARAAPRRRAEYIAGRRCAGAALRLLGGQALFPDEADDRAPIWPPGFSGSISHCHDRALALVGPSARYVGLGIDIEARLSEADARQIAPHALTARELQCLGPEPDPLLVGLAFSSKESLFKALYPTVRRFFYFDAAELVAWDCEGTATLRLTDDLSPQWHRGRDIALRHRHLDGLLLTCVSIEHD